MPCALPCASRKTSGGLSYVPTRIVVAAPRGAGPVRTTTRARSAAQRAGAMPPRLSEPLHVGGRPRRCLDGGARVEQHRRGVPGAGHQLLARGVGHRRLDDAIAEAHVLLLDVHVHRRLRRLADLALQPLEVGLADRETGDAEHHAVAEEDLAVGAAHDRADAPAHERLRRVLARGAAAEVLADHQDGRSLVDGRVERMLGVLLARVLEGVLAHALERHFLQEARGDDAVGVDVVARHGNASPGDLLADVVAHRRISLTSVTAPLMAAAATMAGLIRSVRPVGLPWRPMKLRLLDDALISRPTSTSGFMPRHIEQPAL